MSLKQTIRSIPGMETIRIRTALDPLLWLSAIAPVLCWISAYVLHSDPVLEYGLVFLGVLPIVGTVVAYFILMVKDPDRLQSVSISPMPDA